MEKGKVDQLVELLLEDRRTREAEAQQKEEELRQERERELEEAAARRDEENERRVRMMQEQLDMMREWMERSNDMENKRVNKASQYSQLKLTKLTESEDIEAYLTTFERMMGVYEVTEDRWVFQLAPLLTGKAQQAYAALSVDDPMIMHGSRSQYCVGTTLVMRHTDRGLDRLAGRMERPMQSWQYVCRTC